MCRQLQEGGEEVGAAQLQPRPSRQVAAADRSRWKALCSAAVNNISAGKYAVACTSLERVVAEVEGAFSKEAEELLEPLRLLAFSHRRAGHFDDAYTVMMRAMTLCEKHHGEEGLVTCNMRALMGEPCLPHCGMLCGPYVALASSAYAPLIICSHSSSTLTLSHPAPL